MQASGEEARTRSALVVALTVALHRAGAPAHRLEDAIERVCDALGIRGQVLADPTSLTVALGEGEMQQVQVVRVPPPGLDLGRLVRLEAVTRRVVDEAITPQVALARVRSIETGPATWGPRLRLVAATAASAAIAVLMGGSWPELVAAGLIGLAGARIATLGPRVAPIAELASALVAGFAAPLLLVAMGGGSVWVATASGLIMLVPGYGLTIALTEVATQHLASGTARLAAVAGTFLTLGFGVALGGRVGGSLALMAGEPGPGIAPLPAEAEWWALGVTALALGVSFDTRPRDLGWTVLAGIGSYVAALGGAEVLGPRLGAFAGAIAVGAGANAFARWRARPAALIMVPGIIMLVPGSVGFRSVDALLRQDVLSGVETAFEMALIAASLVAGLLLANALVPPAPAVSPPSPPATRARPARTPHPT